MPNIDSLNFRNHFVNLPSSFFSEIKPTPLPSPRLLHINLLAAELIKFPTKNRDSKIIDFLCGNYLPLGTAPIAAIYAGHQFGHFVPQLGDGRAILLGGIEYEQGYWELQLKGAGPTPYSRNSDGRAVLRSSIREYLCSEAMHGLGIPTTRALSIVDSPLPVYREVVETAGVVMRLSPSFIRFGSFEVFFYRGQADAVRTLADFVIKYHYPELITCEDKYPLFLKAVVTATAKLIAHWQSVGFAHGVMNTDNMSILGLTLDYGPFGFMDHYDPGYICNHSDHQGRYAFDQQPDVAAWNLTRLAQTLTPLMSVADAKSALEIYPAVYASAYIDLMCAKLGLPADKAHIPLILKLLEILSKNRVDYTIFMRRLCDFDTSPNAINAQLRDLFIDRTAFDDWSLTYCMQLKANQTNDNQRSSQMRMANPKYILRNYLAEQAIVAARDHNDMTEIERLMKLLQRPYDEQPEMEMYTEAPPDWAQHLSVSCSS